MTEIQTRLLAAQGPAVLFQNPIRADGERSSIPALANLFGTVRRVAMGVTLGGKARTTAEDLREVGELLAFLRAPEPPRGLKDAWELLPVARQSVAMRPAIVKRAPVQEVVLTGSDIDLNALPIQTCWPGEPAPLITWPLVVTKGPSDAREDDFNLGIYRMQAIGRDRTIMRWLHHRGGAQHHARWKKQGRREPLPACAVIGADPGTILAAVTPVPDTPVGVPVRRPPARRQGRARARQDRAPDGAGGGRDRDRGPRPARRLRRRRALRRPHRLLQLGRTLPGVPGLGDHHAARPDLPDHLHRPARPTSPRSSARR